AEKAEVEQQLAPERTWPPHRLRSGDRARCGRCRGGDRSRDRPFRKRRPTGSGQVHLTWPSALAGATGAAEPAKMAHVLGVSAGIAAVALQPPPVASSTTIVTPLDGL